MAPHPPTRRLRSVRTIASPGTHLPPRRVLGDRLGTHDNALNFIRLTLAALVVVGHGAVLGGFEQQRWHDLSGMAVNGFFAISGFLIAGSRVRTSFLSFLWRRALRLYPAFWVALLTTAFLVAPLTARLSGESWIAGRAVDYVLHNASLSIHQWGIEHLLLGVPYPGVWNGSLWTLWFEGVAYLAAGLVLSVGIVRRRPLPWLAGVLMVVLVLAVLAHGPLDVTTSRYLNGLRLAGFFLAGMILWAARSSVPLSAWLGVPALGLALVASRWEVPYGDIVSALPLAYALLWLGAVLPVRLCSRTDRSYGTYIYVFPLQQLLVVLGVHTTLGYWGVLPALSPSRTAACVAFMDARGEAGHAVEVPDPLSVRSRARRPRGVVVATRRAPFLTAGARACPVGDDVAACAGCSGSGSPGRAAASRSAARRC
ncbi:acyltransferase family protein [Kocuria salsicia]|uniref:Acyltransferase n=1 Tax=Kocuria salsicia TaxID=664639 RepID=A0ABV3KCN8_9MICC